MIAPVSGARKHSLKQKECIMTSNTQNQQQPGQQQKTQPGASTSTSGKQDPSKQGYDPSKSSQQGFNPNKNANPNRPAAEDEEEGQGKNDPYKKTAQN
jgi:hypothetical protein